MSQPTKAVYCVHGDFTGRKECPSCAASRPKRLVPSLTKSQPAKVLEFLKVPVYNNRTHGLNKRAGEDCEHLCLYFDPNGTVTCRICGCEWKQNGAV